MNGITIALSKGRIFEETVPLLAAAGIVVTEDVDKSRKLIFDTNTRMANSAGLWERVWRNRSTHPYVRYITRGDDRVRDREPETGAFFQRDGAFIDQHLHPVLGALTLATEVIATYTYKIGIINGQYSYSTAIGLFNTLVNFIFLITANAIAKRVSDTSIF